MANDYFNEHTPELPDTAPTEENTEAPQEQRFWGKLIQITDHGHNMRGKVEKLFIIPVL